MPSSPHALLIGSISAVADTSELQRDAFNRAFAQHGLEWVWEQDEYSVRLQSNGGRDRIAEYAEKVGAEVDAEALHRTKSELFQQTLRESRLEPRPGVVESVRAAQQDGWSRALVTTTLPGNLEALFVALGGALTAADFDLVLDLDQVDTPKPDPTVYRVALERLGVVATAAVAVEDNVGGVAAATAAGIAAIALPNENTARHDFHLATRVVDRLDPALVRELAS